MHQHLTIMRDSSYYYEKVKKGETLQYHISLS